MRLGIDASNIRDGGGITHLVQLLHAADPTAFGFEKVIVWAARATLSRLPDRPWLDKRHEQELEANYLQRAWWQYHRLGSLARAAKCDLLFVPGGVFATNFRPVVTMSRNMLPFQWRELLRYGISMTTLRLMLLRWTQRRSFRRATGVVFLNDYARTAVGAVTGPLPGASRVIPHGLEGRFFRHEHIHRPISAFAEARPFRVLYVSIVDVYKHQWHVAEAVAQLRGEGLPVSLTLVGPAYPPALRRLESVLKRLDPCRAYLHYLGSVAHESLPDQYASADLCVFASSCENMPNILLEGMASGVPLACSNRGPMPEVLGAGGVYFDPESPAAIASAIRELIGSPELRHNNARAASERARQFAWTRCAVETFGFLAELSREWVRT